jgi:hypothetical protein
MYRIKKLKRRLRSNKRTVERQIDRKRNFIKLLSANVCFYLQYQRTVMYTVYNTTSQVELLSLRLGYSYLPYNDHSIQ